MTGYWAGVAVATVGFTASIWLRALWLEWRWRREVRRIRRRRAARKGMVV